MDLGEKNLLEKLVDFVKKYKILVITFLATILASLSAYVVYNSIETKNSLELTKNIIDIVDLTEKQKYEESRNYIINLETKRKGIFYKILRQFSQKTNFQDFFLKCLKYSVERDMKHKDFNKTLEEIEKEIESSMPYISAEFDIQNEEFCLLKEFMIGIITKDLYELGYYKQASELYLSKHAQQNPNHILIIFRALSLHKLNKSDAALEFLANKGNSNALSTVFKIIKESKGAK